MLWCRDLRKCRILKRICKSAVCICIFQRLNGGLFFSVGINTNTLKYVTSKPVCGCFILESRGTKANTCKHDLSNTHILSYIYPIYLYYFYIALLTPNYHITVSEICIIRCRLALVVGICYICHMFLVKMYQNTQLHYEWLLM